MKNHIGIAEKLNRESILRSGGALLRSRPNCRIGIERESLRCTACGMLSEAAHPASLGGKDDNPYITTDWAESQIELITPTGDGVYADWLRERGPGLHHVKFETEDNYQTIVSEAEQISGRPPYLNVGWPDGRPLVAYADLLDEAGLLIEVSGGE